MPKKKTTKEFIDDAIKVHGYKYDYSKVEYIKSRDNVIITCKIHGDFKQTPFGHTQGYGCKKCANTAISNSKKLSIKDCQISANERGGRCLSTEYINRDTKMKWQCKEGHIWEVAYNNISKSRSWCPKCGKISSANKRRSNIEECNKIANERGGKCLSAEYINNNTKMKWECEEGHTWETTFTHIKSSQSWCPTCSKHEKITIKDCEISATERGGKCLSTEYIVGKKIKWKCGEGHEWESLFSRANPQWCPYCSGKFNNNITTLQEYATERGGKCLSTEYINSNTKMKWECEEGHTWDSSFGCMKSNKSWCRKCAAISSANKRRSNIEECNKIANERGGKCLSTVYINSNTKMKWECEEGHTWETTFTHIKNSQSWCPTCSYKINGCNLRSNIEECNKIANERGGKCLSAEYINSHAKMKWECNEGHMWDCSFGSIKYGSWCPKCNGNKYDYCKVDYKGTDIKVIIICKEHGEFLKTPYAHIHKKSGCPKCLLCSSCQLWKTMGKLCSYCKPKNENKLYQKTKEYTVVKYLKEKLPDYEFIHNKSVGTQCTKDEKDKSNGHLFPDIRFDLGFYNLIVEIDEHKHRGGDYKCDEQRMYDIIAKLGLPCIFIRYNPDNKESNKEILLAKIKKYLELDIDDAFIWDDYGFKVKYLFY